MRKNRTILAYFNNFSTISNVFHLKLGISCGISVWNLKKENRNGSRYGSRKEEIMRLVGLITRLLMEGGGLEALWWELGFLLLLFSWTKWSVESPSLQMLSFYYNQSATEGTGLYCGEHVIEDLSIPLIILSFCAVFPYLAGLSAFSGHYHIGY